MLVPKIMNPFLVQYCKGKWHLFMSACCLAGSSSLDLGFCLIRSRSRQLIIQIKMTIVMCH